MSDSNNSDRYTFCVILDRNEIFRIPNYWFFKIGHVTPADMKMSEITLRIECKHSRIPARPASCRNRPLNSRNLGFGHEGTFFQSLENFEKPGGRAGLRKFARAMRSMFGSVRAARALQDVSMCLSTRALARKSSW